MSTKPWRRRSQILNGKPKLFTLFLEMRWSCGSYSPLNAMFVFSLKLEHSLLVEIREAQKLKRVINIFLKLVFVFIFKIVVRRSLERMVCSDPRTIPITIRHCWIVPTSSVSRRKNLCHCVLRTLTWNLMQVGVNDFMSMSLLKKQKFRKFFTFVATAICMAHSIQTAHCFRFHLCTARYAQRTNSNVCVIDKTRT